MGKKPLGDVIILIPGITGSVLQKDGKDLWSMSRQAVWGAVRSLAASLQELMLENDDPEASDLGDGIRATRLMPGAHLVPGLAKVDGYSAIARLVTDSFSVIEGVIDGDRPANFFQFPYDWRRDNRVAARRLQQLVKRRLPQWREGSGRSDAKVILLAHSMGGLVARYYLEVLEGWRDCRALITFGTPYRGSLNALNYLANGYKKLFVDLTDVMRSCTSVYQLLPIYRALHANGSDVRVAETDGVPGIERGRASQALAFHREIETRVDEHRNDPKYLRDGYLILPFVGTRQPTLQSARLQDGRLTVSRELPSGIDELLTDGDGTVPRLSAIPLELSDQYRETFVAERHSSLQNNLAVLNDLRGRLEQFQVRGLAPIRGPQIAPAAAEAPALSVDLEDAYSLDEPVELRAWLVNATDAVGPVEAVLQPSRAGAMPIQRTLQREDDAWVLREPGLTPGLYRVQVRTAMAVPWAPPPVHDVFEVLG